MRSKGDRKLLMKIWSFFYQISPSGTNIKLRLTCDGKLNQPAQLWLYVKWPLHFSSKWFCSSQDAWRTTWRSVGSAHSFASASPGCGMPCGKILWRCQGTWRLLMKKTRDNDENDATWALQLRPDLSRRDKYDLLWTVKTSFKWKFWMRKTEQRSSG